MPKKIPTVTLTPEQERKWTETRSMLMWRSPAFTHILLSMLNPTKGGYAATFVDDDSICPIAATDGRALIINVKGFFAFTLPERVFVVAHEILHCVFNHVDLAYGMRKYNKVSFVDGHELPYNQQLMNVAMDLVINDALIADGVGQMPKVGCHDPNIATRADSFLDAYRKVFEQNEKNGGGGGSGGFDTLLDPGASGGQDPGAAVQNRSQAAWDTAVAAAITSAKLQGKLGSNLERLLSDVIDPAVSWQDHIRALFARKLGSGGYDWRLPDRQLVQRGIIAPRRSGNGCGEIVVAVDTSGSIGQAELDQFFGEMRGILEEVKPERIHVVWCDADVHKVDVVEDAGDILGLKAVGGGGTDFRPVFDWIADNLPKPEALVYLTDMFGSFPDVAPSYPVIWGDIAGHVKAPFGDVVNIDVRKK